MKAFFLFLLILMSNAFSNVIGVNDKVTFTPTSMEFHKDIADLFGQKPTFDHAKYCMNRYKEGLASGLSKEDALLQAVLTEG